MAESFRLKIEALHFSDTGSVPSSYLRTESLTEPLALAATEFNKVSRDTFTLLSAASEAALVKPAGDLIAMVLVADKPFYCRPASGDQRVASRVHTYIGSREYPVVASGSYGFLIQPIAAAGNTAVTAWFYTYEAPA